MQWQMTKMTRQAGPRLPLRPSLYARPSRGVCTRMRWPALCRAGCFSAASSLCCTLVPAHAARTMWAFLPPDTLLLTLATLVQPMGRTLLPWVGTLWRAERHGALLCLASGQVRGATAMAPEREVRGVQTSTGADGKPGSRSDEHSLQQRSATGTAQRAGQLFQHASVRRLSPGVIHFLGLYSLMSCLAQVTCD